MIIKFNSKISFKPPVDYQQHQHQFHNNLLLKMKNCREDEVIEVSPNFSFKPELDKNFDKYVKVKMNAFYHRCNYHINMKKRMISQNYLNKLKRQAIFEKTTTTLNNVYLSNELDVISTISLHNLRYEQQEYWRVNRKKTTLLKTQIGKVSLKLTSILCPKGLTWQQQTNQTKS